MISNDKNTNAWIIILQAYTPVPEMLATIAAVYRTTARQPLNSVLVLLDATSAHFAFETLSAMKKFVIANTPFIKCAVVVGITGLLNIALTSLTAISGREYKSSPDRASAMEYLVNQ